MTVTNNFPNGISIAGNPVVDGVTFGIGAEDGADTINVTLQLTSDCDDVSERCSVFAYVCDDANGDSVAATAPDTVAIGTDGLAIPLVAGKCFLLTNAAADTFYLDVVLPGGSLAASGAITHAGP